jgi:hypothetical protein
MLMKLTPDCCYEIFNTNCWSVVDKMNVMLRVGIHKTSYANS